MKRYHRRSIRLKVYDYSQPGAYFITICTQNKIELFGEIKNGKMILNDYGKIVVKHWREIPDHYPDMKLLEYVVIPNHIHGIIIINQNGRSDNVWDQNNVGVQNFEPLLCNLPNIEDLCFLFIGKDV